MKELDLKKFYNCRVPYFGSYGKYLVGNSCVKMGGENGDIDFLCGPEITAPRYVENIRFSFAVKEEEAFLHTEVYRVQGEACYCGFSCLRNTEIYFLDFASGYETWRVFEIRNPSREKIKLNIYVVPLSDEGSASPGVSEGVAILKDTRGWCFGNKETKNWCLRGVCISVEGASIHKRKEGYLIEKELLPAEKGRVVVRFSFFSESYRKSVEDIEDAFRNYQRENDSFLSDLSRSLAQIGDEKMRLHVENLAVNNFIQRGISVGGYKYANMYLRDCFGALCGYKALGLKQYMSDFFCRLNRCIEKVSFIPNYFSSDCETFIGKSFHNDCAELPAYYILFAKIFLEDDRSELTKIKKYLDDAFLVQKNFFEKHGYIDFNGDESEQYCTDKEGQEYGSQAVYEYFRWSYASFHTMSLALASFRAYGDLFSLWQDESYKELYLRLKDTIDRLFYDSDREEYWWAYDVENHSFPEWQVPLYLLTPVWIGAEVTHHDDCVAKAEKYLNQKGFLPNIETLCEGFCGHSLAMLLYGLADENKMEAADCVYSTIMNSGYLDRYGCVSEFYSPSGIPNGHGYRHYEGGILIQALLYYYKKKREAMNV